MTMMTRISALALALVAAPTMAAELMLAGGDNKVGFNESGAVFRAPGNDVVSIIDIGSDPGNPRIVADLPLINSVFGPPTNLAITPDGSLALVANAMDWAEGEDGWTPSPDTTRGWGSTTPSRLGMRETG